MTRARHPAHPAPARGEHILPERTGIPAGKHYRFQNAPAHSKKQNSAAFAALFCIDPIDLPYAPRSGEAAFLTGCFWQRRIITAT